ncbi:MAG: hypothetical protein HY465_02330 [Deltaproteobacteria bacterium]|nr:hypothetical protein [Deltaproteobacteria bacterium]
MARIRICKDKECHSAATTEGYCRLHYLRHWKDIRDEKKQKAAKKLNQYIEYICKKHPDHYMEVIKKNLRSRDFDGRVGNLFDDEGSAAPDLPFTGPDYEEEVEKLIDQLKVEKDF